MLCIVTNLFFDGSNTKLGFLDNMLDYVLNVRFTDTISLKCEHFIRITILLETEGTKALTKTPSF